MSMEQASISHAQIRKECIIMLEGEGEVLNKSSVSRKIRK